MKLLYLMYKSCSKFFIRELFLILQITIVIILLNTTITPFVNHYQTESVIANGLPDNAVYYSVPFASDTGNTVDYFEQFYTMDEVSAVCLTCYTAGEINEESADIIFYNREMFEYMGSVLKNGEWHYDPDGCYVNETFYNNFGDVKVGVVIPRLNVTFTEQLKILGTTNKRDVVYNIRAAGSQPEISVIGTNFEYLRNQNPERQQYLAIIPYDFSTLDRSKFQINGAILILKDGVAPQAFVEKYANETTNGNLYLINELVSTSVSRIIKTYKIEAMGAILLAISSAFGIGGYTFLKTKTLQKQMGIYRICGCRTRTFNQIVLITNALLLLFPMMLAFVSRNYIVLGEGIDSTASFLIAFGFVTLIYLIPIIITLRFSGKLSFSKQLYSGD